MKLELTKEDWDIIIEGVENLKHKDFAGEMMSTMFEVMLGPKEGASDEEKAKWEEAKSIKRMERQMKEGKQKEFLEKVEILKAKLVLMRAERTREKK